MTAVPPNRLVSEVSGPGSASSSTSSIAVLPVTPVTRNGVSLRRSTAFTSAPASTSVRAASTWSPSAASSSAVRSSASRASIRAPSASAVATASASPSCAAPSSSSSAVLRAMSPSPSSRSVPPPAPHPAAIRPTASSSRLRRRSVRASPRPIRLPFLPVFLVLRAADPAATWAAGAIIPPARPPLRRPVPDRGPAPAAVLDRSMSPRSTGRRRLPVPVSALEVLQRLQRGVGDLLVDRAVGGAAHADAGDRRAAGGHRHAARQEQGARQVGDGGAVAGGALGELAGGPAHRDGGVGLLLGRLLGLRAGVLGLEHHAHRTRAVHDGDADLLLLLASLGQAGLGGRGQRLAGQHVALLHGLRGGVGHRGGGGARRALGERGGDDPADHGEPGGAARDGGDEVVALHVVHSVPVVLATPPTLPPERPRGSGRTEQPAAPTGRVRSSSDRTTPILGDVGRMGRMSPTDSAPGAGASPAGRGGRGADRDRVGSPRLNAAMHIGFFTMMAASAARLVVRHDLDAHTLASLE